MSRPFLKPLAAAALAALAVSCIVLENPEGDDPGWRGAPDAGGPSGGEFRRTLEFAPGGTLTLENDYGDVAITGWDRDEAEIVAKAATVEPETRPQSARQYRIRKVSPEVEVRETDGGLLVRTATFEGPGEPPSVDYEVRVPRNVTLAGLRLSEGDLTVSDVYGRVEASVDQGDLSVGNYSGPLRATLGTGSADVEVLDLRDGDEITIQTRRGDIVLRLEPTAGAIVEADAPRGQVRSDFELGVRLPAPSVKGWIGQGGPAIILKAADGGIRILKTAGAPGPSRPGAAK